MTIPAELLARIESGKIVLVLGLGLNKGTSASPEKLAQVLSARVGDSKPRDGSFRSLAELYGLKTQSEFDLLDLVSDAVVRAHATESHERVADLISLTTPTGRRPFGSVLYLCYDNFLEETLKARGIPSVPIVTSEDAQFTRQDSVHIGYLWGMALHPRTLRLTKKSLNNLLTDERSELVHWMRAAAVDSTWICLGVDLDDEWVQNLYDILVYRQHNAPQPLYACGRTIDETSKLTWQKWGAKIVAEEPNAFLGELVAILRRRWGRDLQQEERPTQATEISLAPSLPTTPSIEKLSPYKGLPSFDATDEGLFFGRDTDAQIIYNRVIGNRLTIITGPSGAGKSSLLRARVAPNLERQGMRVAYGRIGELGTSTLRQSIRDLVLADLPSPAEESLSECVRQACTVLGRDVVLVIDQFEELFTRAIPDQIQEEVLEQIMALVLDHSLPVRVVLCLRSDLIHRLNVLERWWPDALKYEVRIERLTRYQARQAIVGPLDTLGIRYSDDLVEQILEDLVQTARDDPRVKEDTVFGDVIDPPQLQIVCLETYRFGTPSQLEAEAYANRGTASGILRKYLRDKLDTYGSDQDIAQRVLVTLVGSSGTKRPRTVEQIREEIPDKTIDVLRAVLKKLENDRLVHFERRAAQDYYELAHEYLIGELELTPEMLDRKRAEEWLKQGAYEWEPKEALPGAQGADKRKPKKPLLSEDQFRLIDGFQHSLRPSADAWTRYERALMLRCALEYNHRVENWLTGTDPATQRDVLVTTLTTSKNTPARVTAANLLRPLIDTYVEQELAKVALSDDPPEVRHAAELSLANCSPKQREKLRIIALNMTASNSVRAIEAISVAAQPADIETLMCVATERDPLRHRAAVAALEPYNDHLPSSWVWLRRRDRMLTALALFLTGAPSLVVLMHLVVIYCLGRGTAALTTPWRLAILRNQTILSYVLQIPLFLVLGLAVGTTLLVWLWVRSIGKRWAVPLLFVAVLALVGNFLYRPWELKVAQLWPEQFYSRAEYELTVAGDVKMARRLFTEVRLLTKEQVLVEAWLAGISYLEGNHAQATKEACAWLAYDSSIAPTYEEVASNLITTVHWSIYQLGYDKPIAQSLMLRDQLLQEIKGSWPQSRCITGEELSPFFFGISPANRAFIVEMSEKYAPPALYAYLGVLSGRADLYRLPEGASVSARDSAILTALLSTQSYGLRSWDSEGHLSAEDRYAGWGAFLVGDYNHPALRDPSRYFPADQSLREGAALSRAIQGLDSSDPEAGTSRLGAYMDSDDQFQAILRYSSSPWLDDIYALLMYLWEQQGQRERALEYYAKLMQYLEPEGSTLRRKLQLICDFCNPGAIIGLDMPVDALEDLLNNGNPTLKKAACNPPFLLDLIGLRKVATGEYSDARMTFQRIATECGVAYPNLEVADYLRMIELLEAIDKSPTTDNYLRYFTLMDRAWTWDQTGSVPIPESWFLNEAVFRTAYWPPSVSLEVNPWSIYARRLEDFVKRFGGQPNNDVNVAVSLLRMAAVYDRLSNKWMIMQDATSEERYRRQLRDLAASALTLYLQTYFDRKDIPFDFCRFGGLYADRPGQMQGYNLTQDCVIEWSALLQLGATSSSFSMLQRYAESEIIAMQDQARQLVDRYPNHHLANNLLNWIAWGYCYRANLHPVNSIEYFANYQQALQVYQELTKRYPNGEMAKNAKANIPIIQEKLRNPEARRLVAEGRWTWDTAEKLAPRLQDLFEMLRPERQER